MTDMIRRRPAAILNDRGCRRSRIDRSEAPSVAELAVPIGRRAFLGSAAAVAALGASGFGFTPARAAGASTLGFAGIALDKQESDHWAPGYSRQVLLRWGDAIFADSPAFDAANQTPEAAAKQFGYNNDFTAFLPFPYGSASSERGLLVVNHEYQNPHVMFPGMTEDDSGKLMTEAQVNTCMEATGLSVVEVRRADGQWRVAIDSPQNRRITMTTPMTIGGPAAGHALMQTAADPSGRRVLGTVTNCNGGVTPWGTVLSCEEGAGWVFGGDYTKTPDPEHLKRYYYDDEENDYYGVARFHDRFNLETEPNESNRYEWVVEVDPFDPSRPPAKRTSLGRFAHEGAHCAVAGDGRIVVYLGDDWEFEYCYRFVTARAWDPANREANRDLLDEGTLSVARFNDDGTLDWLPLIHGEGPLTAANGFRDQGEVAIKARQAADLLGATPMDGPEGFAPNPATGLVYLALTENEDREEADAANPRSPNPHGHILELAPPGEGPQRDHAAAQFKWQMLVLCGDPAKPEEGATYHPETTANGWFADPDNLGFDVAGRMWICTDGVQPQGHDGLYAMDLDGAGRVLPKLFYSPPTDAECCGPAFTPDGKAMFVSVQHPAEGSDTLAEPTTRWPDFIDAMPPRPSLVVFTKDDGGVIGS
jgi:hypothetical protein